MTTNKQSKSPNKGGRPTNAAKLEKALENATSESLEGSLQLIRLKIFENIQAAADSADDTKARSEDVKNLHQLWRNGKEVLTDLLREEAATNQKGERLDNIESLVMQLHAKVNNGLSEHSITTANKVDEFQKEYIKHSTETAAHLQQNSLAIEEFTKAAKAITDTQSSWQSRIAYSVWLAGAAAIVASIWVVTHLEPIAVILAPLLIG